MQQPYEFQYNGSVSYTMEVQSSSTPTVIRQPLFVTENPVQQSPSTTSSSPYITTVDWLEVLLEHHIMDNNLEDNL